MSEKTEKGKYRWAAEYKDGSMQKRYNPDGSKNAYHWADAQGKLHCLDRKNIKTWAFTSAKDDSVVAVMDVPADAVVFKRRRVIDINYYNRFHDVQEKIGGCVVAGRWVPEQQVIHRYPEYTYSEVWLLGWRKRETDGSVTVRFKAVYPDGKVDEHYGWDETSWLGEPDWFEEEQV